MTRVLLTLLSAALVLASLSAFAERIRVTPRGNGGSGGGASPCTGTIDYSTGCAPLGGM